MGLETCKNGQSDTVQMILKNWKEFGIDLNAENNMGMTALHWACFYGKTGIAQLIIQNSEGIDLNVKDNNGNTSLHLACRMCKTETVQMILKNWKEFAIDIRAQNNQGKTALDLIDHDMERGMWDQVKQMLETEYSQIDVTESVND